MDGSRAAPERTEQSAVPGNKQQGPRAHTLEHTDQSATPSSNPAGPTSETLPTPPTTTETLPKTTHPSVGLRTSPTIPATTETAGQQPRGETSSETDSVSTSECSTCSPAKIEGLRRAIGSTYGGASFHPPPFVLDGLSGMFPIPEINADPTRMMKDEDLETYAHRMEKNGYHDMRRTGDGHLIFRSTVMRNGVRGEAWEGDNNYRARNGRLYDTREPPPGRCFNCNGNHWRRDCPQGGRR